LFFELFVHIFVELNNIKMENKLQHWQLIDKIEKAIKSNMKEIPYEGTDVDVDGMKCDILEILYEIAPEYNPENKLK
jgi:hypothetical protein